MFVLSTPILVVCCDAGWGLKQALEERDRLQQQLLQVSGLQQQLAAATSAAAESAASAAEFQEKFMRERAVRRRLHEQLQVGVTERRERRDGFRRSVLPNTCAAHRMSLCVSVSSPACLHCAVLSCDVCCAMLL